MVQFLLLLICSVSTWKLFQQDCIPVGCIPPACWPYLPACTAQGWVGVCFWGMSARGGCLLPWGIPACTEADPPVNRILENITLPQTSFADGNNVLKKVDVMFPLEKSYIPFLKWRHFFTTIFLSNLPLYHYRMKSFVWLVVVIFLDIVFKWWIN